MVPGEVATSLLGLEEEGQRELNKDNKSTLLEWNPKQEALNNK